MIHLLHCLTLSTEFKVINMKYYTLRNKKTGYFITLDCYSKDNGELSLCPSFNKRDSVWLTPEREYLNKMFSTIPWTNWGDSERPHTGLLKPITDYEIVEFGIVK